MPRSASAGDSFAALAVHRPDCLSPPPLDMAEHELTPSACLPAHCKRRRSVIVYDVMGGGHRAGLLDRANTFSALGNLAATLCAHVVVGRPCDLLAPKHNIIGGVDTPINCSITRWSSRYVNLTYEDGEEVLRGPLWHAAWLRQQQRNASTSGFVRFGLPAYAKGEGQVDTHNATALAALYNLIRFHWQAAASAAARGAPFEWRIRDQLWSHALHYSHIDLAPKRLVSKKSARGTGDEQDVGHTPRADGSGSTLHMHSARAHSPVVCPKPPALIYDQRVPDPLSRRSCIYTRHDSASLPLAIAERFLSSLDLTPGSYHALHLRRNDKANPHVCNTTLARVLDIVRHSLVPRRARLVVFTDERRDQSYLRELQERLPTALRDGASTSVVGEPPPPLLRVDMGEAVMAGLAASLDPSRVARARDNFLTFAASLEVYRHAAVSLHVCTACPRGDVGECTNAVRQLHAEPPPRATGLMPEWVHGGTG